MSHRSTTLAVVLVAFLGLTSAVSAQTTYEVLFQNNMAVQIAVGNFDPATDTVDVRGSFNGWSGPTDLLVPDFFNDSLYVGIVNMDLTPPSADSAFYKYTYTNSGGVQWEGGSDRIVVATGNETDSNGNGIPEITVAERYWSDITPSDIFTSVTDVYFEVDMRSAYYFLADSGAITYPPGSGNNVTAIDTVNLAAGFGNTTPSMAWVWDLTPGDPLIDSLSMKDDGANGDLMAGDSVYTLKVTFGVGAPKSIVYKHGIAALDNEGGFAQDWAVRLDTVAGNRVYDIFGANSTDGWYDPYVADVRAKGRPAGTTATYEVLFQNNMAVQIAVGNFDPATDTVDVRGSFNGWSGPTDLLVPDFFNDSLYVGIVNMDLTPPSADSAFYKYTYTNSGGVQWEGGSDRIVVATGSETDGNGNGIPEITVPERYWSDITPADIFTSNTEVFFEVDMRPAFRFLADSGAITFPPGSGNNVTAIDTVNLAAGFGNTTPSMAWVWDLTPGDPLIDSLSMKDDGANGDLVAGDSVYTLKVLFEVGAPKGITYKHGIAALDNEAGFAQDWAVRLDTVANFRVFDLFGANSTDGWYDNYLTAIRPSDRNAVVPEGYAVYQNYPNPFNPTTNIDFVISTSERVTLEVYNVLGQKVATLVNGQLNAGAYTFTWNGSNDFGERVTSGVYIYRFTAGDFSQTKKMILLK